MDSTLIALAEETENKIQLKEVMFTEVQELCIKAIVVASASR
jgi:hypothetical protein